MEKRIIFYQTDEPVERNQYDLWIQPYIWKDGEDRGKSHFFIKEFYKNNVNGWWYSSYNHETIEEIINFIINDLHNCRGEQIPTQFKYIQSKNEYQIEQIKEFQDE